MDWRFQYQAKAETPQPPAAAEAAPEPLLQAPVVIRAVAATVLLGSIAFTAFVEEVAAPTPQVFIQDAVVIQPPKMAEYPQPAFVPVEPPMPLWQTGDPLLPKRNVALLQALVEPPQITPISWLQEITGPQPPPKHQLRLLGGEVRVDPLTPVALADFGWWRQQPNPQRRPTRPDSALAAPVFTPVTEAVEADLYQAPVVRIRGKTVLYQAKAEPQLAQPFVPLEDFDWYQQHPDQVSGRKPLIPEGCFSLVQPVLDTSWFVQHPDQTRSRKPTVAEGWWISDPTTPVPPISWLVQHPTPPKSAPRAALADKAEPVFVPAAAPVPDYVQVTSPDPVRPPRPRLEGFFAFQGPIAVVPFSWGSDTVVVFPGKTTFYQAKAEPVFVPAAPDLVSQQGVNPTFPIRRQDGFYAFVEAPQSFAWFQQQPEPRQLGIQPRGYVTEPIPQPSFGWWHQVVDQVVRRKVLPESFTTRDLSLTFNLEWLVQGQNPVQALRRLEGFYARGEHIVAAPAPDLVPQQGANVFLRPTRPEGFFAFVQAPAPAAPAPDLVASTQPDIFRRLLRPQGFFALVDFSTPAAPQPETGWIVQHPEPRRIFRAPQGGITDVFQIVALDWLVQQPQPRRFEALRAFLTVPEVFIPIQPPYSWQVQHPAPLRLERRPTELLAKPVLAIQPLDWLVQVREPIRKIRVPQGFIAERIFFVTETITADKWYQQHPGPRFTEVRLYTQPTFITDLPVRPILEIILFAETGVLSLNAYEGTLILHAEKGTIDLEAEPGILVLHAEEPDLDLSTEIT